MRTLFGLGIYIYLLTLCVACEEALPMFESEQDRLNFVVELKKEIPTPVRKTFVYDPESLTRDTIYVPVKSMGFLRDYDRFVRFEQVKLDSVFNAESGVHYVAFDDAEVKDLMFLPAGQETAEIPIIVLRDPTLRDTVVVLQLRIVENEYFKLGDLNRVEVLVEIGDMPMKPANWLSMFRTYGRVKHRFLINYFGWRFDEETFEMFKSDYLYAMTIRTKAQTELNRVNAERAARGEKPLCESDGTLVRFQ